MARERQELVVGRETERALFRTLIAPGELPFCVLCLYGPGGVGKTTLMRSFADLCRASSVPVTILDARSIEPTPDGFAHALSDSLSAESGRQVLIIDTYETIEALDGYLRDVFLPSVSDETVIVLSGRHPLPAGWHDDPGWRSLTRTIALRNLDPDDSRQYHERRAVPAGFHQQALDFTHGHPLALSLLADVLQRPEGFAPAEDAPLRFLPEYAPDVVHTLLERFVEGVPTEQHRAALEICALVRYTDESLLQATLINAPADEDGSEDASEADAIGGNTPGAAASIRELFDWLRGLSFIEADTHGLFPHDSAREALLADLRWRSRDRYVALHDRVRNYYAQRLRGAQGQNQERLLYDAIFLHRDSVVVRAAFTWQEQVTAYPDTFRPSDAPAIRAMVALHEGEESARIAATWLQSQPEATIVFRDLGEPAGEPVGFFTLLTLPHDADPDKETDPAVTAALRYIACHAPLRPGEVARHLRFWMARDSYQSMSPIQSLLIVHALRQFLLRSRLAYTLFACADPDLWAPVFDYVEIAALTEAQFTIDGRRYGVYGHDWRAMPAATWLARLFEREVAAGSGKDFAPPPIEAPLIVLSEAEFATSVRDAWRGFHRADGLNTNPLLRSRLVVSRTILGLDADNAARSETLRTLLRDAASALQADTREARGYRALFHTYLQPAPTQEQAADILDLPFNTYRRHLGEGVAAVTAQLWQMEIGTE